MTGTLLPPDVAVPMNLEPARHASASAAESNGDGAPPPESRGEHLYLTGRPALKHFLRYVRGHAVHPPGEAALVEEWRVANEIVRTLTREEAGLADGPPMERLGPEYEPLLVEFLKNPLVRHNYNTVPTDIVMVELDRLVVYQKHIDLGFVRELEQTLGRTPTDEQIFRACLPCDPPQPPVKWSRAHGDAFVFVSPSNDLRFLGAMRLQAYNLKDYPPPGNLVGIVGIAVGFGSNFLNAIYAENRLILNNGSHRAYALRKLGITHVPCVVQHVSLRDELALVASSDIDRDPDAYLKHPRPSMLKDYFDPRLHTAMPVHRRMQQVTIRFEFEEGSVPAL
jgi:hypothetical protein